MTQLLISVRNVDEALLALAAGADILDLKDPGTGALGALDMPVTQAVLQAIDGEMLVSATVGEGHASLDALLDAASIRFAMGVDIVKMAAEDLFYLHDFVEKFSRFTREGHKLVAVFFVDAAPNFALLPVLKRAGFYGAMLDTQHKEKNLLQHCIETCLQSFAVQCEANGLIFGLAGSLQPQDIEYLAKFNATYLGFRGGVCENSQREQSLSRMRLEAAAHMLRRHNMHGEKPQPEVGYELHGTL